MKNFKYVLLCLFISSTAFTAARITNTDISATAAIAWSKMANITNSRLLVSDGSGDVTASSVTATEAGYLAGVTSALQTQLDAKQASDADLTAVAALSGTNDIYYRSAANTWSPVTIGDGLDFTGGELSAEAGAGGASNFAMYRHYENGAAVFFARNSASYGPLDPDADAAFQEISGTDINSNMSCSSLTNTGNPKPGITCTVPAGKYKVCSKFHAVASSNQTIGLYLWDGSAQIPGSEYGARDYSGNNFYFELCGIVDASGGTLTAEIYLKGSTTWTIGDNGANTDTVVIWEVSTP
jgi:hypothetical protein